MIGQYQRLLIYSLAISRSRRWTIEFIDENVGLVKRIAGVDFGDFIIWRRDNVQHTNLLLWLMITIKELVKWFGEKIF